MSDLTRDDLGLYVDIDANSFEGLKPTPTYLTITVIRTMFTYRDRIEIDSVEVV